MTYEAFRKSLYKAVGDGTATTPKQMDAEQDALNYVREMRLNFLHLITAVELFCGPNCRGHATSACSFCVLDAARADLDEYIDEEFAKELENGR